MTDLAFDGLVCDLDGVVYRGDEAIPGAAAALNRLRETGVRLIFCTNNSRGTVSEYLDRLTRFGVTVSDSEIVTSAVVTGEVVRSRWRTGATGLVVGGEGLRLALDEAGVAFVSESPADFVAVGLDFDFDYDSLRRAAHAVREGAALIATNDDAGLPTPDGVWPGAGAILAAVETAAGVQAEVMGKPHPPMMETVARRLTGCRHIAVVGDRPETDLAGGRARGWTTILVISGVTRAGEAGRVEPAPDLVLGSIAELA
jgi:HAD superfamily hydrolase (TIGR01450 family)